MKIGFTGTRQGMTAAQRQSFDRLAAVSTEFHHGCCKGADWEAVSGVVEIDPRPRIIGYPCTFKEWVDDGAKLLSHETRIARSPLDRNRDIVNACDVLVACPKGPTEEFRSGTWSTVRYARKQGKRVVIIWPDGSVTEEAAKDGD